MITPQNRQSYETEDEMLDWFGVRDSAKRACDHINELMKTEQKLRTENTQLRTDLQAARERNDRMDALYAGACDANATLQWIAEYVANIDFHLKPRAGIMASKFIATGANFPGAVRSAMAQLDAALDSARREGEPVEMPLLPCIACGAPMPAAQAAFGPCCGTRPLPTEPRAEGVAGPWPIVTPVRVEDDSTDEGVAFFKLIDADDKDWVADKDPCVMDQIAAALNRSAEGPKPPTIASEYVNRAYAAEAEIARLREQLAREKAHGEQLSRERRAAEQNLSAAHEALHRTAIALDEARAERDQRDMIIAEMRAEREKGGGE